MSQTWYSRGDRVEILLPIAGLTVGRVYEIQEVDGVHYHLVDDYGILIGIDHARLEYSTFAAPSRLNLGGSMPTLRCTCGAGAVNSDRHSSWCDL